MTLTWMNNNNWADASGPDQSRFGDIPDHGGLSEFGREVIREMNRLGMIVDVSHVSDETFWDVLEVTDKPVIASHSCAYALNPHYRNVKDDMLVALAENGGVIGLNFASGFLSKEFDDATSARREEAYAKYAALEKELGDDPEKLREARRKLRAEYMTGLPTVPIGVLADHIEHVVKVAGIDHVGLGSDFDGIGSAPEGLDDATGLYHIVVELRKRGWNDEELRKLLGLNTLRVIRANCGG
jgi:membrane dipeptidase